MESEARNTKSYRDSQTKPNCFCRVLCMKSIAVLAKSAFGF